MKKIIILGTAGNCIDIFDTIQDINQYHQKEIYRCVGFLDDCEALWNKEIQGVKVLGPLEAASEYKDCFFINGIGSPKTFLKKKEIVERTKINRDQFENIIHPTASVSRLSSLGQGVVIFQHVTITSNVTIGDHVIVLPNSIISHDSEIGDYTCIAGGVCVSGNVKVGTMCYLGTNSSIINDVAIGDYCLVGMGSVVLENVPKNSVVYGCPAKVMRTLSYV